MHRILFWISAKIELTVNSTLVFCCSKLSSSGLLLANSAVFPFIEWTNSNYHKCCWTSSTSWPVWQAMAPASFLTWSTATWCCQPETPLPKAGRWSLASCILPSLPAFKVNLYFQGKCIFLCIWMCIAFSFQYVLIYLTLKFMKSSFNQIINQIAHNGKISCFFTYRSWRISQKTFFCSAISGLCPLGPIKALGTSQLVPH